MAKHQVQKALAMEMVDMENISKEDGATMPQTATEEVGQSVTQKKRLDLGCLISTGDENKANKPKIPVDVSLSKPHVIHDNEFRESPKAYSNDKWEKTSICSLPGGIEVVNLFHYNEKSGVTQVFIILQDRKVVGSTSQRLNSIDIGGK